MWLSHYGHGIGFARNPRKKKIHSPKSKKRSHGSMVHVNVGSIGFYRVPLVAEGLFLIGFLFDDNQSEVELHDMANIVQNTFLRPWKFVLKLKPNRGKQSSI